MKLNTARKADRFTHEGAPAKRIDAEAQLRRSVMSCLLWEDEFYEDGQSIAQRIVGAAEAVPPSKLAEIAIEARKAQNLRHVPLLLASVLCRTGAGSRLVSDAIYEVIGRADEITELLAVYWKDGKRPLSAQLKKGLARAFTKFDAYALGKYNRDSAIKLRDVLFLACPKPIDDEQAALWKKLAEGTLEPPDTWEVALSGGADKKQAFERLIREGRLGYLALLRNLRNMEQAGVDASLICEAIIARKDGAEKVLPFRFVAASRAAPRYERELDEAMVHAIGKLPALTGETAVLVDVSGSMSDKLSRKSDMTRMDAAAALASMINGRVRVFTFSNSVVEVPPRKGMAGVDAIRNSQPHGGTELGAAVALLNRDVKADRLIVITDEQSQDHVPDPVSGKAYMINVASNRNGVGYGRWTQIDGFSENVLRFIAECER